MTYVDAFAGIGGFSLALHQVDPTAKCILAIENNPESVETYKRWFPGVPIVGDITQLDLTTIPEHDILFGGFPCQGFSRNGKWYNKNNKTIDLSETRDTLFLYLLQILVLKQPKYFIFENVKGLLTMKDSNGNFYFNAIVNSLIQEAGYKLYHKILNTADFGLPQQRQRVFFVGIRKDLNQSFSFPKINIKVTAIEDILEPKVDSKYLLENAWKNRKILHRRKRGPKPNHSLPLGASRLDALKEIYNKNSKPTTRTGLIESVAILYGDVPSGTARQHDKIYSIKGISPTITTFANPSVDAPGGFRQLTPRECARLQGFPDCLELPKNDAIAYKQIGNAVSPVVVAEILKQLLI